MRVTLPSLDFYPGTLSVSLPFFFFNDTATTEIYTLSLHDALPISVEAADPHVVERGEPGEGPDELERAGHPARAERSEEHTSEPSHANISYAVFCLKKKKTEEKGSGELSARYNIQHSSVTYAE